MSRLKHMLYAAFQSNEHVASVYFASPEGFTIFSDDQAKRVFDKQGKPQTFDAYARDWYIQAVNAKGVVFSSVRSDYFTGEGMVTCSMPVYSGNTLLGVVAIDIRTETINSILLSNTVENSSIVIVDGNGNVEISTTDDGIFGLKPDEKKNLYQMGLPTMDEILRMAAAGGRGTESLSIRADQTEFVRLFEDEHDVVLAVSEKQTYREYTMSLHSGDILVLYTDGFPEYTNKEMELFTERRMLDALNDAGVEEPKALDDHLREKIKSYCSGAVQFDDMTMMTICYHGCSNAGNDYGTETE